MFPQIDHSELSASDYMPKTIEELVLDKTDKILRILAVIATKGLTQRDQIALLNRAGFQPKHIADLLGTSSNTVRVELVVLRRSKKGKRAAGFSKKQK